MHFLGNDGRIQALSEEYRVLEKDGQLTIMCMINDGILPFICEIGKRYCTDEIRENIWEGTDLIANPNMDPEQREDFVRRVSEVSKRNGIPYCHNDLRKFEYILGDSRVFDIDDLSFQGLASEVMGAGFNINYLRKLTNTKKEAVNHIIIKATKR